MPNAPRIPALITIGGANYHYDAALMQTRTMQLDNWKVFPVGLGLGCDYGFMDRVGRIGETANSSGESVRTSGNPIAYEQELTEIFDQIISNPHRAAGEVEFRAGRSAIAFP